MKNKDLKKYEFLKTPSIEKIREVINKNKYILLIFLIGVIFMILPNMDKKQDSIVTDATNSQFNLSEFENSLCEKLSLIDGVGRVEIILSLKSGEESVYESDIKQDVQETTSADSDMPNSNRYERSLSIVSGSDYGESPVLIKTVYPEFRGAIVICDGANNDKVCLQMTNAIKALCGIGATNISIIKMKE